MKIKNVFSLLIFFLIFFIKDNYAQHPDLILFNGKIFTSDTAQLYVQALAISGNKILAAGTNKTITKLASAKTRKIDLKGKTVVPGFNDAHDHLGWLIPVGQSYFTEFSVEGPTKAAVVDSLLRLVRQATPGQWIQGTIGLIVFNDTTVRRKLLDSIAPHNPVALQIMWGHGMILNSTALRKLNISDTAVDPLSGWYDREPGTKYLTGVLYEGSEFPAWEALTVSEPEKLIKALRSHANDQLSFGITTVQNMSGNLQGNAARRFFADADLPVRTRIVAMPGTTENGRNLEEWNNKNTLVSRYTYVSGIKYIIDGTPLEQTALMSKPYPGRNDWYGTLNYPVDTIKQILREALITDRQLLMHIVGDSATNIILQLMKEMASADQWKTKRVRIEHGSGIVTTAMAKDVNDMGIIIIHTPQYGMDLPLRSRLSMGINIAIGPDAVINPFLGIMLMTTAQSEPNENITREEAIIAYTKGSAYAEFAEKNKGTLTKGMLADIAVLSKDVFTIPSEELPSVRSLFTIVDGKIMYPKNKVLK
jgi:predicted amidohydrolase YtcJ